MQTIAVQKAFFKENENKQVNISVEKKSGEMQEYYLHENVTRELHVRLMILVKLLLDAIFWSTAATYVLI